METLFTIGAYGFAPGDFFQTLRSAGVDLLLDIRRRRGMRGALYSFANVSRLKGELATHDISYQHLVALAPDAMTRTLQDQDDAQARVAKRNRMSLGSAFIADYSRRTLDPFDWHALLLELEDFQRPVLFCVEGVPEACHRSLVGERLARLAGISVVDLVPPQTA